MKNKLYTTLGLSMLLWYSCLRWTLLADKTKYFWVLAPINLTTAFLSIAFIIPTLFLNITKKQYGGLFYFLGIFLFIRNSYYAIEDIIDFHINPLLQTAFILLDLTMVVYVALWYTKESKV